MHKVVGGDQDARETTALNFAVGPDCLRTPQDEPAQPVRVGELDGVVVEPYDPPVTFIPPIGDETTRAYRLAVGDRTLCVFLTRHATSTDDEWNAAVQIMDTLRAVTVGQRVRVTFTLDGGWDIG